MTATRHTWLLAFCLAVAGCDDSNSTAAEPSTAGGGGGPTQGTPRAGKSERCEGLERSAWQLADEIGEQATCAADADCRLEMVEAHCLSAFICPIAVSDSAISTERAQRASELAKDFRDGSEFCGCTIARCAQQRAVCHPTKKRCMRETIPITPRPQVPEDESESDAATLLDAALPPIVTSSDASARADAALHDDAGANPYACKQASDCAIRNVGNCCGYYPRCVNANAILTPPDCSNGMGGVCGFPEISSCDCRNEQCVSLQNGNPI